MMLSFGINSVKKFDKLLNIVKTDVNNAKSNMNTQSNCVSYSKSGAECNKFDYGYDQWSKSKLSLLISDD